MATDEEKELFLSVYYLDKSTIHKIDSIIDNQWLPIQRKTSEQLIYEIVTSNRTHEEKMFLLKFL